MRIDDELLGWTLIEKRNNIGLREQQQESAVVWISTENNLQN